MKKQRLDQVLVARQFVNSRSQATNYIKLGKVLVNGVVVDKAGQLVSQTDKIDVVVKNQYVSRAGLKLESVAQDLKLNFEGKVVLDVGSSTGGFTDYALKNGAKKVIAVDVGTNQLHPSLRQNKRIALHEKTDIRDFKLPADELPDLVLVDVSFISLTKVLPHIYYHLNKKCVQSKTQVVAMLKPQFEAHPTEISRGVVKNNAFRRQIIRRFENWVKQYYKIIAKRDSQIAGEKGNLERFYLLEPMSTKR